MKPSPKAQAAIDRIVTRFQTGDLSPVVAAVRLCLPAGHPAGAWSLGNKALALAQADTLDCRGFRSWQDVGRQVVRGGSAIYIFKPLITKGDPDAEEPAPRLIGFAPIPVFAAAQTEGDPAGLADVTPTEMPPLAELAHGLGIRIQYTPLGEELGNCTVTGDRIRLGTAQNRVFWHELGHAVHARIVGKLRGGQNAHQETVAEFTSCVLAALYDDEDSTGNAWQYIQSYNADPMRAIGAALADVGEIVAFIEAQAA